MATRRSKKQHHHTRNFGIGQRMILAFIRENPGSSAAEIGAALKGSNGTHWAQNILTKLYQRGLVQRKEKRPARYWPVGGEL